tara:strand:+ start:426 stop:1088 length:663 start_codon:yes stop_codon:yes gene_type:complete
LKAEFLIKCEDNVDFARGYAALVDSRDTEGSGAYSDTNEKIAKLLIENRTLPLKYIYPDNYNDFGTTYLILSVAIKGSDKSIPNRFEPSGKMKLKQYNDEDIDRFKNEAVKEVLGTEREFISTCEKSTQTAKFWSNMAYQIILTNLNPITYELNLPTPNSPAPRKGGRICLKHPNTIPRNWQQSTSDHSTFIKHGGWNWSLDDTHLFNDLNSDGSYAWRI